MDELPTSKGFNAILVVVDRLSKYSHFIPLKQPFTAMKVVEVFILDVVKLDGFPVTVVLDKSQVFVGYCRWNCLDYRE